MEELFEEQISKLKEEISILKEALLDSESMPAKWYVDDSRRSSGRVSFAVPFGDTAVRCSIWCLDNWSYGVECYYGKGASTSIRYPSYPSLKDIQAWLRKVVRNIYEDLEDTVKRLI